MATNSGNNFKKETVKDRSQIFNSATGNYIKRDTSTGKFIDVKSDGKPFRGVRRETSSIKANPSIPKAVAEKAEAAVIKVKNNQK